VARGVGLNLVSGVCAQLALFGIMLLLARVLGGTDVGRYAQCFAVLSLLGLLSLSGLRAGLTRFVAVHLADDDHGAVRGTVRLGLVVSAVSAALVAVALALLAPRLAAFLHDPALVTGLRLVALTLPASVLGDAALSATRGWRTQRAYALIGQVYEPGMRLLLTVLALAAGYGLGGAFWALVIAAWTATGLAMVALRRQMRTVPAAPPAYRPREIFGYSVVSWASSLSSTGLIWLDTLLLGAFANAQLGVYNVATRLVTVAIFVLPPVNAAFAPTIAYLYQQGRLPEVRRVYGAATGWVVRLSMPAFVALLILPDDLLSVFGRAFTTGAVVTVVLAAGQLVNAATGPCGTLLNMSGKVTLNMLDNVAVLLLNLLLNLVLIPRYGITGAAVAWSVSLVAVNLARVLQVWRQIKAVPVTTGMLKGLLAGAASLAAAAVVHGVLSPGVPRLVAGLATIAVVYPAGVLALRLSREDTMVLRGLLRRGRGVPG
jgi:O-antigen/teichoic acid export membrane protein